MQSKIENSAYSLGARKAHSIEHLTIESLVPDPKNARLHTKKQIGQIAASIKSFGFNVPILVNAVNQVVAGHGRLLAAKKLGLPNVPTIRIDHLDEAQTRAFMIADNRLTEIAQWDDRLLAEQLKELSELDLTFEIEAIGFDTAEIDLRIASLSETAVWDEKPLPVVSGPPVSRLSDIWILGRHRLLCGDATDASSYPRAPCPQSGLVMLCVWSPRKRFSVETRSVRRRSGVQAE
jgi:ParB-like chromosome segregation protein Spo0J